MTMNEHALATPNKRMNYFTFIADNPGLDIYTRDGQLYVSGDCTAEEAQAALDAHQAPPEPTVIEKLATAGISIDDLKAALGL